MPIKTRRRNKKFNKSIKTQRNIKTMKSKKNKKIKLQKYRKHQKKQRKNRSILKKAIQHVQNKPKKIPVMRTAKEFVQKAMKNMNKGNNKKASLQLISALTILASYNPMAEQKFDMGSISNLRTGPVGVPTADTMLTYHDPRLNIHQNNALSKKELRFLSKHHPQIYESIMM